MAAPDLPETVRLAAAVVAEPDGAGMVLFDTRTSRILRLDEFGAAFWTALDGTASTAEAVSRLADEFAATAAELAADLAVFAGQLGDAGLLDTGEPEPGGAPDDTTEARLARSVERYLDLVEAAVTGRLSPDVGLERHRWGGYDLWSIERLADTDVAALYSLIGAIRMRNVRDLAERVLADGVPGDLMECGVWRGGAAIMMRAVLEAHGCRDRTVWLADSFRGLPVADTERYPIDAGWAAYPGATAVPLAEVAGNFRRFGLLDESVRFVEGWFEESLPTAAVGRLALLRLDADLYASTSAALEHLYDRVSPGGFVIIDDYAIPSCAGAVDDFRSARGIDAPLHHVDWNAVWWRVPAPRPEPDGSGTEA